MAIDPDLWTLKTTEAFSAATEAAKAASNPEVTPDHLLIALLGQHGVISIDIYDHVEVLEYTEAHILSGGLLLFSFLVLLTVYTINRRLPIHVT